MEENTWLDYVAALGSIATPTIVLALTAIGWKFKSTFQRRIELEDKLREDRIDTYNKILEPFIILLMTDEAWQSDKKNKNKNKQEIAISTMLSLEYRRLGFKLALMAPDSLVKSFNNLMHYFYNLEGKQGDKFIIETMTLLGSFLIEIRRSMGNEATKLDHWDMCDWWMTDARKYKAKVMKQQN